MCVTRQGNLDESTWKKKGNGSRKVTGAFNKERSN